MYSLCILRYNDKYIYVYVIHICCLICESHKDVLTFSFCYRQSMLIGMTRVIYQHLCILQKLIFWLVYIHKCISKIVFLLIIMYIIIVVATWTNILFDYLTYKWRWLDYWCRWQQLLLLSLLCLQFMFFFLCSICVLLYKTVCIIFVIYFDLYYTLLFIL